MSLSIQVPTVGQVNSTEAVKVTNSLTNLASWANGNVQDSDLSSPNNSVRKLLLQTNVAFSANTPAATYFGAANGVFVGNGASINVPIPMWVPDAGLSSQPTDFQVANKSPFCRIRVNACANGTGTGVTFTTGLYQLSALAGVSPNVTYTFAAVLAGSTVAAAPLASQSIQVESGQFAMPTTGNPYSIGIALSGLTAANSTVAISAQLYGYNA